MTNARCADGAQVTSDPSTQDQDRAAGARPLLGPRCWGRVRRCWGLRQPAVAECTGCGMRVKDSGCECEDDPGLSYR